MDFILGEKRDKTGDGAYVLYFILAFWLVIPITILLWIFIFAAGAARLAYITHNSIILAGIAFVLPPLYYIYHAFTK